MKDNEYLFVGGPWDGRRVCVSNSQSVCVPVVGDKGDAVYTLKTLRIDGAEQRFYLYNQISEFNAVKMILGCFQNIRIISDREKTCSGYASVGEGDRLMPGAIDVDLDAEPGRMAAIVGSHPLQYSAVHEIVKAAYIEGSKSGYSDGLNDGQSWSSNKSSSDPEGNWEYSDAKQRLTELGKGDEQVKAQLWRKRSIAMY